ncbi:RNA helicase required for poly(A+) mRNA export [Boothiomyces macroporosus]|uniref:ATP-dependent RNA helicase DBP5 n=1 Tax=Boothiomyces macroporosus TaxID=261099 RepID=A0AAD5Y3X3_9FUNG|nr:RNA helicase required for poly(A+) mRNA export [Boothiomyces macroporosus]
MSGWGETNVKESSWGKDPEPTPIKKESSWADEPTETIKMDQLEKEIKEIKKHPHLAEVEHDVQVTLADSNDIYHSVSTFEDLKLKEELLKGVYAMGYQKPSKIQATALPLLLADPPKNMIGQSQAGTGKTAAFSLNILSRINIAQKTTQALVIAPARELARQILDNLREMGKFTQVVTSLAVPGAIERGEKVSAHVVVGTPGTVMELIKKRQLDVSKIIVFVLDEADSMLDQQGLGDTSVRIKNVMPKTCQIVLFSATFPDHVREYATKFAVNANTISLKQEELSVDSIKQFYMDCKNEQHKAEILSSIYDLLTIGQSIIFVRTRRTADYLQKRMTDEGHSVSSLHGDFEGADRDKAIDDFREGRSKVLITTNVLARGIDILQVNLVINYDMPVDKDMRPDAETYIHRIGRTGRFGRQGVSINFCHDKRSFEEMKAIESYIGREIIRVPTDNIADIEKILKKEI